MSTARTREGRGAYFAPIILVALLAGETVLGLTPFRLELMQHQRPIKNQLANRRFHRRQQPQLLMQQPQQQQPQQQQQQSDEMMPLPRPVLDQLDPVPLGGKLNALQVLGEQEACCPRGLKETGTDLLCASPCCPGLVEGRQETPHLGLLVWCNLPSAQSGIAGRGRRSRWPGPPRRGDAPLGSMSDASREFYADEDW